MVSLSRYHFKNYNYSPDTANSLTLTLGELTPLIVVTKSDATFSTSFNNVKKLPDTTINETGKTDKNSSTKDDLTDNMGELKDDIKDTADNIKDDITGTSDGNNTMNSPSNNQTAN